MTPYEQDKAKYNEAIHDGDLDRAYALHWRMERHYNWFERLPRWAQIVVFILAAIYFSGGLLIPFAWSLR